jgi:NADH-quinone oxidoreductase subunit B
MAVAASDNVFMTQLDAAANWARSNSLWPMPFATACCGIELMATASSRYDIARFGAEVMRFSPRQCDLLIVAGRVVMKMLPVLQRIWLQMPEPKWCISMGACACTGGVFDTYAVVLGVDRFIPVDIYVPGCPPRPEQLLASIIELQHAIKKHGTLTGKEFAERRTSTGPAPLSLDELRRSRDYLLSKSEMDDAASESREREKSDATATKQHP